MAPTSSSRRSATAFVCSHSRGRARTALSRLQARSPRGILIFTDADTKLTTRTLLYLAEAFADSDVGGVTASAVMDLKARDLTSRRGESPCCER